MTMLNTTHYGKEAEINFLHSNIPSNKLQCRNPTYGLP